jgi:hypothetical protein
MLQSLTCSPLRNRRPPASHGCDAVRDWGVNAVAVPRSDEYLGEYVPACAERLAWLTCFTGSAGLVLVLKDTAHMFVDGRYTMQARAQTDPAVFDYQDMVATPLSSFLESTAAAACAWALTHGHGRQRRSSGLRQHLQDSAAAWSCWSAIRSMRSGTTGLKRRSER